MSAKRLVAFSVELASKLVVKPTSGRIHSASGRLDATAASGTYYLHLWDATDVPAEGTIVRDTNSLMAPQKIVHILGADDEFSFDFGEEEGRPAHNGIAFGLSSTEFLKTASGAYLSITAEYS
jgi:hypothetical protein